MTFTTCNGGTLFYTDEGSGRALLLIHGWGADSHSWSPHLPELTTRYRVLAPDLRGHGRSEVTPTGYRSGELAADLADLVGRRGVGPVVAIGHSMGGTVATVLAVEHPELVSALVVLDPAYGADDAEMATVPARLAELWRYGSEAAARQMAGAWTAETPAWLATWTRRLMLGAPTSVLAQAFAGLYVGPDAIGPRAVAGRYLARVRQPTLAVFAGREPAAWFASALPRSTVECWPGAGHYLHQERPEAFLATLRRWLG